MQCVAFRLKTGNWGAQKQTVKNLDPDHINDYFAGIATDQNYDRDRVIQGARQALNCPASHVTYSKYSIERILARISKTSPGNDKVPYWLFLDCSSELAGVVANIVNLSVGEGVIPAAWRTAVITPVPKCTPASSVADLRPIAFTPILSRIVERIIVKDHIFPAIPTTAISDQYGFKPTGSTTAAIVYIINSVSVMLETNNYVHCLTIDFSKLFDSVDHLAIIQKLKVLNISDNILHWEVSFLTDRNQFVHINEWWSFT